MEDINKMFNSNYKDLDDLKSKAYIIHFSSKDKPWKFLDVPFASEWYKYYLQSPFKNKKLDRVKLYNRVSRPLVSVIIPCLQYRKISTSMP
jgi:lipopolysaccharide biosynthesis glycosyltransferase